MSKPKPREYIVHELFTATNTYFVMASSKAEALAKVQADDEGELDSIATEPMPSGKWWIEPRRPRQ